MESHLGTQLKVGIFIVVGIFLILVSMFMLGADRAILKNYVHIHAHFEQVQGLAQGSVVSLSGVTVGNIESITFTDGQGKLDVKMKIDSAFIDRITKSSQVEIRTQGALGDKFIFIIPGSRASEVVKEGDTLEIAHASDILGIMAERGNETGKIFDIINELQAITHTINTEHRMEKIMNHLEIAAGNFSETSIQIKKVMTALSSNEGPQKMQDALTRIDNIIAKIDRGEGSLGAFINDPTLHNQLKSLLGTSTRKNNLKSLIRTSIEKEAE